MLKSILPAAVLIIVTRRWHCFRYINRLVYPACFAWVVYAAFYSTKTGDRVTTQLFSYIDENINFPNAQNGLKGVIVLLGLLSLLDKFYQLYDWIRVMAPLGIKNIYLHVQDKLYETFCDLWIIKNEIDKEKRKFAEMIEHDIRSKSRAPVTTSYNTLPSKGVGREEVLKVLKSSAGTEDEKWVTGKLSGGVYHGGRDHINFLNQAFNLYSIANPLHLDVWPSALRYETEIISMTSNLVNGGDVNVCGCTTSGGTESILLAIKAHRDYYAKYHNITEPEMIACVSAHAAVDKACEMLRIRLVKIPMDPKTYKMDVMMMTNAITANTIMIYASAPSYPQGVIDPITQIGNIASYYGIGLHVDCCLGGFVLPFIKKLGIAITEFDFSIKGVTSMSCDTHKYGYALKGTSVLLYRNAKLRACQYFAYTSWPGGFYTTATVAGSRSFGLIAQTWASLVSIGEEGYLKNTQGIVDTVAAIANGIRNKIPELLVIGDCEAMIVCFTGATVNVHCVGDAMSKRGWSLNSLQRPNSVHICCTVRTIGKADEFLADLRSSVDEVSKISREEQDKNGNAAVYGLASSMPSGPVKELLIQYNDSVLQKL